MKDFPWGQITKIHKIQGLPDIIEYVVGPDFEDAGQTNYQIEDKTYGSISFTDFHQALMASLCSKYDSADTAPYVWRLLKQEEA